MFGPTSIRASKHLLAQSNRYVASYAIWIPIKAIRWLDRVFFDRFFEESYVDDDQHVSKFTHEEGYEAIIFVRRFNDKTGKKLGWRLICPLFVAIYRRIFCRCHHCRRKFAIDYAPISYVNKNMFIVIDDLDPYSNKYPIKKRFGRLYHWDCHDTKPHQVFEFVGASNG